MNRQEKIESIRRGDSVIKNDMQGDERCLEVLNECEIGKRSSWADVDNTNYGFYGIDDEDDFYWLTEYEFDNRPQILMSELVEVKPTEPKEVFTVENLSFDYNDVKTLTDAINKLNQMAFDAYK